MPTPKKKISRSRRDMRRYGSTHEITPVQVVTCSSCGDATRPHRVCKCGAYAGKAVLPAPEKTAAAEG